MKNTIKPILSKNVMLENILPGDIYTKSKASFLRLTFLVSLFLYDFDRTEIFAYDIIQSSFPEKTKDLSCR